MLPSACRPESLLVHSGRDPHRFGGLVNTPIHRGSTILSRSLDEWEALKSPESGAPCYARLGTPTTQAFETAVAELEGGHRAQVFPSGLSACTHALLAFVRTGDHVLMTDCVYGPTRAFATGVLARLGVHTSFFDPAQGSDLREHLRPNTRVVYLESPGSWTFEMQDVPAIAEQAHRAGAVVVMDNTWATPLYFRPFEHGVDVSVHAATKYLVGHSDALLGVATASKTAWPQLAAGAQDFGQTAGPDDLYLGLRGLRTLDVRLRRHWENGVALAESLVGHPLVERVLHPALPGDRGHALWRRDYRGASGVFGVVLRSAHREVMRALVDRVQLFGIGLSWGGYESLILPAEPVLPRSVRPCPYNGRLLRLHAGLEHAGDLIADLRQALDHAAVVP
jgi:cysteine-S-conjugate beta-lyase